MVEVESAALVKAGVVDIEIVIGSRHTSSGVSKNMKIRTSEEIGTA